MDYNLAKIVKIHFRDNQVCVTIMDLSHLTQLPPAFMNETQKTVGLKAWMTCLSVEQVKHLVKFVKNFMGTGPQKIR